MVGCARWEIGSGTEQRLFVGLMASAWRSCLTVGKWQSDLVNCKGSGVCFDIDDDAPREPGRAALLFSRKA